MPRAQPSLTAHCLVNTLTAGLATAVLLAAVCLSPAQAGDAEALAEKFSLAGSAADAAARDRVLAAKKLAAEKAREAAVMRAAESRRRAEDARRAALISQQRIDEAEMLAQARADQAEAAQRDADVAKAQAAVEAVERERQAVARVTVPAAAVPAPPDPAAADEPGQSVEDRTAMTAAREREGRELIAKLTAMRERVAAVRAARQARADAQADSLRDGSARTAAAAPPVDAPPAREPQESATALAAPVFPPAPVAPPVPVLAPPAAPEPPAKLALAAPPPARSPATASRPALETHATILLVLERGRPGRFDAVADPVLCIRDTCFIGSGPTRPAVHLSRSNALGPINTVMFKAGACNRRLACIFRAVDFNWERIAIQPVDLRMLGHDRRAPVETSIDPSCTVEAGKLTCANAAAGQTWRAWIVPESVATAAGPGALEAALANGLR